MPPPRRRGRRRASWLGGGGWHCRLHICHADYVSQQSLKIKSTIRQNYSPMTSITPLSSFPGVDAASRRCANALHDSFSGFCRISQSCRLHNPCQWDCAGVPQHSREQSANAVNALRSRKCRIKSNTSSGRVRICADCDGCSPLFLTGDGTSSLRKCNFGPPCSSRNYGIVHQPIKGEGGMRETCVSLGPAWLFHTTQSPMR